MIESRSIFPFDDEDHPKEVSLFRIDPQNPPIPRMPSQVGPDSFHYRKQRNIDQFWLEWFDGQGQSLDDLFEQRLKVAWRITRELAVARGVITERRQKLSDVTKIHPSPWSDPFHFFSSMSDDPIINAVCQERRLPMLPPDIPAVHLNGMVDKGYDPTLDESLLDFIKLTEHVCSRRLFIPRTRSGRMGCKGLFDPQIARIAWPTPVEIMHFEEILVERVYGKMISTDSGGGDAECMSMLRLEFDLHPHEIRQVLAMARAHALVATGLDDPETFFFMEIARMKSLAAKQTTREDFRGAAQTSRDMLRLVSGRDGGGNEDEDYDRVVEAEIAREKKRLPAPAEDDILDV